MLLSMTGFGNSTRQTDRAQIVVEMKAVNNRYLKISSRLPDFASAFEADIEKLIRDSMARGAVQLNVRIRLDGESGNATINKPVAIRFLQQLNDLRAELGEERVPAVALADVLSLPNVVAENDVDNDLQKSLWPDIKAALQDAIAVFATFRQQEGESMKQDLIAQCDEIRRQMNTVEGFAPTVVDEYRQKLVERIQKAIAGTDASIGESDVLREVALFADKCDINEEIMRLKSHLQQFDVFLQSSQSQGRKLEFVGQEMFREINTIGSKANHVGIAHSVVEMKACIERIREVLQNVE